MFCYQVKSACESLVLKNWEPYETSEVPGKEGFYVIGHENERVLYFGRSGNLRTRLNSHKAQEQDISKFVRQEFGRNDGATLKIKWLETKEHKCDEGVVMDCLTDVLGYWPLMNKRAGDRC